MSVTSADVAVSLEHVRKTYGGDQPVVALDDVDVRFARGTATAVMGPSGSGKSTLLHCASGLDRPDAGTVRIGSTDLASMSEKRLTELRRSRVGFVFQAFNLVGALNVEQNILLPSRLSGQRPDPAWVAEVVDRVGLGDRLRHRPAQLSGGQQQRAAIARALVTRPEVIFCDEPTGALDTRTAADVLSLLRSVVDQAGQTVVMVTHDPVAASYADRVVVLADGRIVRDMPQPGAERIAEHLAHLGGRDFAARPAAPSLGQAAAQTFAGSAAQSLARATARPAVRGEG
ncbi:ABC transporter ATP-binding protein [Streptomyces prasinopilosus]|uniref:ABC transporter ATP-binding protein n=1 Tax=Streptomyces prasinopilosus TaxID=67344 RepID=UPI0006EB5761|nr:ABC transporter ATP-binding protein [Streptomyces prasinopilosus]